VNWPQTVGSREAIEPDDDDAGWSKSPVMKMLNFEEQIHPSCLKWMGGSSRWEHSEGKLDMEFELLASMEDIQP